MKKLLILVILASIGFFSVFTWWNQGLSSSDKDDTTPHIFVVEKGAGIREISNDLKKENLIKDPIVFFLYVRTNGIDKKIQAGDFRLTKAMSAKDIAEALTHGSLDTWVTIPEGKRAEEVADILQKTIANYDESWRDSLNQHEGYLFPDTYLIPKDVTIDTIITIMKNNFDKKYLSIPNINNAKLTKEEIVTLASMVEREAKFPEDRPMVASVMHNRLDIGMKLDIDATIQYALGYQADRKSWWKKELTYDDLEISSPYNTYRTAGLPPGPISNPGYEVLNAVVNPSNTDYLFYISDSTGHNHYAKTLAEHNANIEKYGL